MPVKIGNTDIPRIKVGNETIKRVYQGESLVYGLYDVHYYDRNYIDTYKPKEYAWGYANECVELPKPKDASDPDYTLDGYPTHWGNSSGTNGWYSNYGLTTQKNKIDINDQSDFDMYARWRQHRYAYDANITYDVYRWEEGSGGFKPIPQGEYSLQSLIDDGWLSPTAPETRPQCTFVTASRLNALGSAYVYANEGTWWWDNAEGLGLSKGQTPKAGAVACYSGHVAFVEEDTPVFCHGNWGGTGQHPVETVCVTTSMGAEGFLGYVYTDLCIW